MAVRHPLLPRAIHRLVHSMIAWCVQCVMFSAQEEPLDKPPATDSSSSFTLGVRGQDSKSATGRSGNAHTQRGERGQGFRHLIRGSTRDDEEWNRGGRWGALHCARGQIQSYNHQLLLLLGIRNGEGDKWIADSAVSIMV